MRGGMDDWMSGREAAGCQQQKEKEWKEGWRMLLLERRGRRAQLLHRF